MRRWLRRCLIAVTGVLVSCTSVPNPSPRTTPPTDVAVRQSSDGIGVVPEPITRSIVHFGSQFPVELQGDAASPYLLQPGDEIDIRDPDWPQFDVTTRIRSDGVIALPYLGAMAAAGHSPEALRDALRERLRAEHGNGSSVRYLLQAGDEIELKFPYAPDINERITVRPDGWLQLQLIGAIRAEGLSPEALRFELQRRYATYLRKPDLSVLVRGTVNQRVRIGERWSRAGLAAFAPQVSVRNAPLQQVFVGGEVARPGVLTYRPGLTLIQAAFEAGGRLPGADLSRVVIVRRYRQGAAVVERDLRALLAREAQPGAIVPAVVGDVMLQPADVVVFAQSRAATVSETLNEYVFKNVPFLRNAAMSFTYLFNGSQSVR